MSVQLTGSQNTAIGLTAGAIEVTILQPLLFCKNSVQQRLPLTMDPRKLYRGVTVSITNMGILSGLQFPLARASGLLLTGGSSRPLSDRESICAGFIGGAISGLACAPMELVLVQQQRFGGNMMGVGKSIVAKYGLRNLWRGLLCSCIREGIFTAGYLGLGPALSAHFRNTYDYSPMQSKVLGAMGGGIVAATFSHPADTIKTCMQGDLSRSVYGSLSQTFSLLREEGVQRFYKGWGFRTARMCCAIAIMSECKDRLPDIMFPQELRTKCVARTKMGV